MLGRVDADPLASEFEADAAVGMIGIRTKTLFSSFPKNRIDLLHEIADVLKLTIDRGESDKRDVIECPQAAKNFFADESSGNLTIEIVVSVGIHIADDLVNLARANRTFVTGFFQAAPDFFSVKGDSRTVLLDDLHLGFFDSLVRREAASTLQTLATTADHKRVTHPSVDDFGFIVTAEDTHHWEHPFSRSCTVHGAE